MELHTFSAHVRHTLESAEICRTCPKLQSRRGIRPGILQCSYSCQGRRTFKPLYPTNGASKPETDSFGGDILLASQEFTAIENNGTQWSIPSSRKALLLDAYEDEYEGVIINPEGLPTDVNAFSSTLQSSLCHWKSKGKRGVWLKIPIGKSELVPIAIKEGFVYHHAESSYVMLIYWIPGGTCLLPSSATHQVGIGGFVVNEKMELLVVQEKQSSSTNAGIWKLPTGFIHEEEEIFSGAVREVREETGIDTEFVEVLAFRHAHGVAFGKADLFFVCLLKPLSSQIVVDDLEIEEAKWMPLSDFMEQPIVQKDDMLNNIMNVCIGRLQKRYRGLRPTKSRSLYDGKLSSLYFNVNSENEEG